MSIKITKNYTKIPNDLLSPSQLSVPARYLHCVLLMHSREKDCCWPSQKLLGETLGFTDRHIRTLLEELEHHGLIVRRRWGWNRSNTYTVAKEFTVDRNGGSYHLGSKFPLQRGNTVPDNKTYLVGRENRSYEGIEDLRKDLTRKGFFKGNRES